MSAYDDLLLSYPGLIAYYPLDETSGSTAIDASGNGHHGTWDNAIQGAVSTIPIEVGETTAATFAADAVRRITLPSSLTLNVGDDFTFVTWARVPEEAYVALGGKDDNRPLFNIGNFDDPNRCTAHLPNLASDAQGAASFDYGSTAGGRTYGPDLQDRDLVGAKIFVACVADVGTGERSIYVNGVVAGADVGAVAPTVPLSGGQIGWWVGGRARERFVGDQAGVAFFRRSLTANQIQLLYCAGDPTGCGTGWGVGRVVMQ